ncbi:hypothetical protein GCM10017559_78180 [Streptosporangium longisporum]|uniref:Cation/H+ exchanger transmembrane domain-containing protein n=1 Tax=Streptosporangium longisporum TaxID=46187 RepID=A0ABP6LDF3_9ACTN
MPSAGSSFLLFLVQVGVLLSLALLLGRLAARLGLPVLVGELLAGVLLGPTVLGHAAPQLAGQLFPAGQTQLLDAFGQIGVLLLVGITGAQLDPGLLRERGAVALRISLAGLLVPLALGVATGYLLPGEVLAPGTSRDVFAVFIGVTMCVTALPVIAKTLSDLGILHRRISQFIVTAALFDDAVGWLLLSFVSAMAAGRAHAGGVAATVAYTVAFVAAAVLLCRPLARRALPAVTRDAGSSIATAVSIVLFSAAVTGAMGMEALFGAFVAGAAVLTLMDPVRLAPLRTIVMSVFAPVFLAGIGLRLDLTALTRPEILLVGVLLLLVATAGKFAGAYLGGADRPDGPLGGAGPGRGHELPRHGRGDHRRDRPGARGADHGDVHRHRLHRGRHLADRAAAAARGGAAPPARRGGARAPGAAGRVARRGMTSRGTARGRRGPGVPVPGP